MGDCIVTKAGPGTIAEACIRGLPMMLSSFLPGQEAGNVPFVTEGGFGAYSPRPRVIAKKVCTWLQNPHELEEMSRRAREAAAPTAASISLLTSAKCLTLLNAPPNESLQ